MKRIVIILAHPQFQLSHVNKAMIEAASTLDHVTIHDLYEASPDFHIRVRKEQKRLLEHDIVVLQYPFQWYSTPSLLKEWLDLVLQRGWAYADGDRALNGKSLLCAVSTGGHEDSYGKKGYNRHTIETFMSPMAQTAHLCHMNYLPPLFFYDAHHATPKKIKDHAEQYRKLLIKLGKNKT